MRWREMLNLPIVEGLYGWLVFVVVLAVALPLMTWLFGADERKRVKRERESLIRLEREVASLTERVERLEGHPPPAGARDGRDERTEK
jgi:hypothetical protein